MAGIPADGMEFGRAETFGGPSWPSLCTRLSHHRVCRQERKRDPRAVFRNRQGDGMHAVFQASPLFFPGGRGFLVIPSVLRVYLPSPDRACRYGAGM